MVLSYQESKRQGKGYCLPFISVAHGRGEDGVRVGKRGKARIVFVQLCGKIFIKDSCMEPSDYSLWSQKVPSRRKSFASTESRVSLLSPFFSTAEK